VHKKQSIDTGKAIKEPIAQTCDMILGFFLLYLSEIIPPAKVEMKPRIDRLRALIDANSALWKG
tara:strand:- start:601 stop:792 length:192 start_codon:yes stop_codon:yes gene_type:complete